MGHGLPYHTSHHGTHLLIRWLVFRLLRGFNCHTSHQGAHFGSRPRPAMPYLTPRDPFAHPLVGVPVVARLQLPYLTPGGPLRIEATACHAIPHTAGPICSSVGWCSGCCTASIAIPHTRGPTSDRGHGLPCHTSHNGTHLLIRWLVFRLLHGFNCHTSPQGAHFGSRSRPAIPYLTQRDPSVYTKSEHHHRRFCT